MSEISIAKITKKICIMQKNRHEIVSKSAVLFFCF